MAALFFRILNWFLKCGFVDRTVRKILRKVQTVSSLFCTVLMYIWVCVGNSGCIKDRLVYMYENYVVYLRRAVVHIDCVGEREAIFWNSPGFLLGSSTRPSLSSWTPPLRERRVYIFIWFDSRLTL